MEKAFLVPPEDTTDKYPELVMKCIWKLSKNIAGQLVAGLDAKQLLFDVQSFLESVPPMEWKSRTTKKLPFEDMPLKTLKTILHELTFSRGLEILSACNELFEGNSYTTVYVKTFLKSAHIIIPEEMESAFSNEKVSKKRQRSRASLDSPELTPAEIDEKLKDICGRICSKPDTRSETPRSIVQIDAFVASLGSFFQKYIERGLARLESEYTERSTSPVADMESYRNKLFALKSQMFGTPHKPEEPLKRLEESTLTKAASNTASPLRTRLESPAAKFARFGSPKNFGVNTVTANEKPPVPPKDDAVISNLKERLARLKQQ